MAFSVETALDTHVKALEETREPDGYWHPSGLFGCARKAVYDFLGTPKDEPDRRSKRIFRIGHMFHEFLQTAVGRDPELLLFLPEVKILDEARKLKGHADGLGFFRDGHTELFEFKSIRSGAMKYASELPKDDHRKQTIAYTTVLRQVGGSWRVTENITEDHPGYELVSETMDVEVDDAGNVRLIIPPLPDLEDIRYVYMSKDDMEIREFTQKHTAEKEAWLDGYLAELERHVYEEMLPDRLPNKTLPSGNISPTQHHYLCGYCPFAARCWDEEGA